ncbi:DUF305 domain-containing protein [Halovulum sp. GXIMD14794]
MTDHTYHSHTPSTDSATQSKFSDHGGSYRKFFAMIGTSTAVMLGLMYLNTYAFEHVYWSETRFYMAFVMGAAMAIVMLTFMLGMYRSRAMNIAIYIGSAIAFAGALWLVRSQAVIQDVSYLRAMIPHHSIAIMTSERANITDPRVAKLADGIIEAQNKEIAMMRYLIEDIQENGEAGEDYPLGKSEGPAEVGTLAEALAQPVIAAIDPAPLKSDEIERALGQAADCTFRRAVTADPILAVAGDQAVTKISGHLVVLDGRGNSFLADGLEFDLAPAGDPDHARLLFTLNAGPELRVGYSGYTDCTG